MPRTDQGRWLLAHQGLVNISKPAHRSMGGDEIDLVASVDAIEAEARAATLAEVRAAMLTLPYCSSDRQGEHLHRIAVIAVIDDARTVSGNADKE